MDRVTTVKSQIKLRHWAQLIENARAVLSLLKNGAAAITSARISTTTG